MEVLGPGIESELHLRPLTAAMPDPLIHCIMPGIKPALARDPSCCSWILNTLHHSKNSNDVFISQKKKPTNMIIKGKIGICTLRSIFICVLKGI